MSDRMSASICIGGKLPRSRVPDLLQAIGDAYVSLEWGGAAFKPATAEGLLAHLENGQIWLCDEESHGEFAELEATCRSLDLSYTRYAEDGVETDAELVDWRPGMAQPLAQVASSCDQAILYVPVEDVRRALEHLKAGRTEQARQMLGQLCPEIPELPPFEIVGESLMPARGKKRARRTP